MFENKKPLFSAGRILKIEMLEDLRDFTRNFIDVRYKEYSDGIITGCDLKVEDHFISIDNGIIKYKDVLYILKGQGRVQYESNNQLMVLKVTCLEPRRDCDYKLNKTELHLDSNDVLNSNEIELCRFKLRAGAILRENHVDFTDLSTEYDTINTINCKYAALGEPSLSPDILRTFGKELLKYDLENEWDINFVFLCVQSKEPIEKEIIIAYLRSKLNIEDRNYTNEELYYFLLQIVKEISNSSSYTRGNGRGRAKKILLD